MKKTLERVLTAVSVIFCWSIIGFQLWIALDSGNDPMMRGIAGMFALFALLFIGTMTLDILPYILTGKESR